MIQNASLNDFLNAVLLCGGRQPPKRAPRLQPFGALDLTDTVPDAYAGLLVAERNAYVGQPIGLSIVSRTPEGFESFAELTKVHPEVQLAKNEVLVKTYSENATMRKGLLASGYFEDTGRRADLGFCDLEVWRITDAFVSAFAEANPRAIAATKQYLLAA